MMNKIKESDETVELGIKFIGLKSFNDQIKIIN